MRYYIIAGEASGDLHGSNLMKSILGIDAEAEFRFWGGDLMANYGGQPVKHIRELAFMGFVKVVLNIRTISKNIAFCKSDIANYKPDVVILIDYAGFNLQIAKFAKTNGLRVHYYISPKIWAWKTNRVHKIKQYVDRMFTILPFETNFYAKYNFEVTYVGNPVNDAIFTYKQNEISRETFILQNQLSDKPIVALLAGSRVQEIKLMLPVMIQVCEYFSEYQFIIAGAPSIDTKLYESILGTKNIPIVYNQTYALLSHSTAALVTSGTATLETALFDVPQIVCYHTNIGNLLYKLGRKILKVKWLSLVNLILNRQVVNELIQNTFNLKHLVPELELILNNSDYRNKMLEAYRQLHVEIGSEGASEKAALEIYNDLKTIK